MKHAKLIITAVVLLLFGAIVWGSFYMLDYSLTPPRSQFRNVDERLTEMFNMFRGSKAWYDSLTAADAIRDTTMIMNNGERQHALFVRSPYAHGRTAILVHGYCDRAEGMLQYGLIYNRALGYNLLLPDLHAHGKSQGKDIQMGWKDRLDVMQWMGFAEKIFRDSLRQSQMVVHGVSMGAATTMCISGEKQPQYVKCFVEDCGYTSAADEFKYELMQKFSLPSFPLVYTTSLLCKIKFGWWFGEASPLKQVAKCHLPMFFIHGDDNHYVPTWMVYPLYNAKPKPKEIWVTSGCQHASSYRDYTTEYTSRVIAFVKKYIR